MTSTETQVSIADQRRAFVERQIMRASANQTGTEWFEQLHSLRARGALLGGAEKWDRGLRMIETYLNDGDRTNREIVILALARFRSAVDFPRV